MAKFVRRRGRKYAKKGRRKMYRKRSIKPRFPDGLNVKLQHNTISLSNTPAGVPTAIGSGCQTLPFPGAVINGITFNDITGAFLFRLRDSLQWNQFATLYDRCKLLGAKVTFIPQWSQGYAGVMSEPSLSVNYRSTALIPTMKIVRDYDDSTPPTTINSVWARRGRIFRLNRPFSVFVKPRMRSGVWSVPQGSGTASLIPGASVRAADLDVATAADVGLFGLKFGIKDWNGSADMYLKIEIEYHVAFKNMLYNGAPPKGELVSEEHDMVAEEGLPCEDEVISLKV